MPNLKRYYDIVRKLFQIVANYRWESDMKKILFVDKRAFHQPMGKFKSNCEPRWSQIPFCSSDWKPNNLYTLWNGMGKALPIMLGKVQAI
jgi:hypothetical protein